MIKKLSLLILSLAVYFSLALPVFAEVTVNLCPKWASGGFQKLCTLDPGDLGPIIQNLITILFIIATIAALFFLIFGGIRWITSGGDKAKLEESRNIIVAAVIGLVLTFLSYFILNLILRFFGLPTAVDYIFPTLLNSGTGGGGP